MRDAPEMTVRTCAKCGKRFVWPVGSKPPYGLCRHCQPDQMSLT